MYVCCVGVERRGGEKGIKGNAFCGEEMADVKGDRQNVVVGPMQ
jgi:hypothetical protein